MYIWILSKFFKSLLCERTVKMMKDNHILGENICKFYFR